MFGRGFKRSRDGPLGNFRPRAISALSPPQCMQPMILHDDLEAEMPRKGILKFLGIFATFSDSANIENKISKNTHDSRGQKYGFWWGWEGVDLHVTQVP